MIFNGTHVDTRAPVRRMLSSEFIKQSDALLRRFNFERVVLVLRELQLDGNLSAASPIRDLKQWGKIAMEEAREESHGYCHGFFAWVDNDGGVNLSFILAMSSYSVDEECAYDLGPR